jgi:hypothetical protein
LYADHRAIDAEIAYMRAHLRWLYDDAIAEDEADLTSETKPYHREVLERDLAWMKERRAQRSEATEDEKRYVSRCACGRPFKSE